MAQSTLTKLATVPMLTKGMYLVRGAALYYVLDTRPVEGLLLIENCYTMNAQWEKANVVRSNVKEVIKTT
jgi:hypothetical protein